MSGDDYLWDGSGTPDPEVQRLEEALGTLRHRGELPPLGAQDPPRGTRWPGIWAAAAVLLVAVGGAWLAAGHTRDTNAEGWAVARLSGTPTLGARTLADQDRLRIGEWLETDAESRAHIAVASIGEVEVGPRSRVRLRATSPQEHRLELERGVLEAFVTAPPRLFLVDTPAGQAVDLGCKYRLGIDEGGDGALEVELGQVALAWRGREALVPAGARCETRRAQGPGTPHYSDAAPELQTALRELDFRGGAAEHPQALVTVLCEARPRDSLTLWHLLARVGREARGRVYDRLASLTPPPATVTRAGVLDLDATMLAAWRDALGWSW